MIRNFSPGKIIEVGSGFSSAVMTDTNRLYFDSKIEIVHIEPYPYHLRQAYGDDYVKLNLIEKSAACFLGCVSIIKGQRYSVY